MATRCVGPFIDGTDNVPVCGGRGLLQTYWRFTAVSESVRQSVLWQMKCNKSFPRRAHQRHRSTCLNLFYLARPLSLPLSMYSSILCVPVHVHVVVGLDRILLKLNQCCVVSQSKGRETVTMTMTMTMATGTTSMSTELNQMKKFNQINRVKCPSLSLFVRVPRVYVCNV